MLTRTTPLLALLPLATAHFQLTWPAARGFSDDTSGNYPCGGFDTVSSTRQELPLTGAFPLQLNMEHTETRGQVVLALGSDPTGDDFTIVLRQTFSETGPQDFCIGGVTLPSGVNITEGTNATIQVLTNGDPSGGLYQCADVTFTSTPLAPSFYDANCRNSTGVSASFIGGGSPNGTSSSGSETSSASGSAAPSATAGSGAAQQKVAGALLGVAAVMGMAVL